MIFFKSHRKLRLFFTKKLTFDVLVIVNLGPRWHMPYASEVHPGNMLNSSSRKTWCLYISFCSMESCCPDLTCVVPLHHQIEWGKPSPSWVQQCAQAHSRRSIWKWASQHWCAAQTPKRVLQVALLFGYADSGQDTGSKQCFLCKTFSSWGMQKAQKHTVKSPANFWEYKQLDIASDEEVLQSWQRLAEKSMTLPQAEFNQWQQAAGLTYDGHALVSSKTLQACHLLKPISLYCFDFTHTLCSHGVMNGIFFLVLDAIYTPGPIVWDNLHSWMGLWALPKKRTATAALQGCLTTRMCPATRKQEPSNAQRLKSWLRTSLCNIFFRWYMLPISICWTHVLAVAPRLKFWFSGERTIFTSPFTCYNSGLGWKSFESNSRCWLWWMHEAKKALVPPPSWLHEQVDPPPFMLGFRTQTSNSKGIWRSTL